MKNQEELRDLEMEEKELRSEEQHSVDQLKKVQKVYLDNSNMIKLL